MKKILIAIIVLCLFSGCSRQPGQANRPDIEQDIHIVDQLASNLSERKSWPVTGVKINLTNPAIIVTCRPPTGTPKFIHAWPSDQNDFNVPMMRINSGGTLYQISEEELTKLKTLNEKLPTKN